MPLIEVHSNIKQEREKKKRENRKKDLHVSDEAQNRLAEILSDAPRLVDLNGTMWEVHALRMGTQNLICQKVCEINKAESASYGDVVKQFAINTEAVVEVIALVLLNDKKRIFQNGDVHAGYSKEFKATKNTLLWDCDVKDYSLILLDCFELIDISFFLQALGMLQIFRAMSLEKKRLLKERETEATEVK